MWSAHRWYGETCGAGGTDAAYHSTQLWLLWPAKYLSVFLFGDNGGLDLCALGVLCSVLAGLPCAGLVLALRGPLRVRAFVAGGIGAVFADSTFAGYFVSPYSEPAALLGIVGTLLALVVIWRRGHTTVPTLLVIRHEILPRWSRLYGHMALWLAAAIPAHLWTEMLTEGSGDTTRRIVCVAFMTVVGLPVLAVCSALPYDSLKRYGGFVAVITATGRARFSAGHTGHDG